ncbi:hypothetical protein A7A76_14635 [Lysobacter enzymogenes]|uniref:hypothetical protein n=1 Tax=Lysobacter enzymogenes TaxID=69 RepID=UPI0019D2D60F|nr:hypothetical protein [Lysobacter enzymogenes]MBN7135954.1 hypothetical protein [Lysobacter enzymogenes]
MGQWREHARLKGRFLPDYPDDLQVIAHDGGPRIAHAPPELIWVRVVAASGDVFDGIVLNQPHGLRSVAENGPIRFLAPATAPHPVMVSDKYLRERADWTISPCDRCGFDELFDAPSDLVRAVFPDVPRDAVMEMFTAKCPLCGGIQGLEAVASRDAGPATARKPWWRFWR